MTKLWIQGLTKLLVVFIALILLVDVVMLYGNQQPSMQTVSAQPAAITEAGDEPIARNNKDMAPEVMRTSSTQSSPVLKAISSVQKAAVKQDKVVYLTFDDGPSRLTDDILHILDEEEVTATFFVLGKQAKQSPEVIHRIAEAGHAIGNHSYNHKYDELYSSFPQFWGQIKQTEEILREITGERTPLVRAPGGTYGHFDETYFELLETGGYKVFDWNVDSGDSKRKGVPAKEIVKNATSEKLKNEMIVLLHDSAGHEESVKALPDIIEFYKKHGYSFRPITPEQKPVTFSLSSSMKRKPTPSNAWIEHNVEPNAVLFEEGKTLVVEVGGVATTLATGEYELKDGRYVVPLRSTMERLGAQVKWDGNDQTAHIIWGNTKVTADPRNKTLNSSVYGNRSNTLKSNFISKNGGLWLPLRDLLEAVGYDAVSAGTTPQERKVTAQLQFK